MCKNCSHFKRWQPVLFKIAVTFPLLHLESYDTSNLGCYEKGFFYDISKLKMANIFKIDGVLVKYDAKVYKQIPDWGS